MLQKFHYDTIGKAIEHLKEQGFTLDFNLNNNGIEADGRHFDVDELEIVDIYRYEGQSDPADESIVYALTGTDGTKGILVSGYGATADEAGADVLSKLHYKYQQHTAKGQQE